MKPNKNIKGLIIGALIVVTGIILVVIGKSIATEDSTILRDQTVDNLDFKNAKLEFKNNVSTYTVDVTNTLDISYNLKYINIELSNDDKTYILIGYIGESLSKGETRKLTASIDKDITNITGIYYSIQK